MIESISLQNYGSHQSIDWTSLGKINLVIGANGRGKSFLLKALYTAMKTIEVCGRGQNNKSAAEILADKLYWTFQTRTLGDLVRKGAGAPLSYRMVLDGKAFSYHFGETTAKVITKVTNEHGPRESNTLFLPEKEVLSLCSIIRKSREQDSVFGFDDTYLDLVRAISMPVQEAPPPEKFTQSRQQLRALICGEIEYDTVHDTWTYLQIQGRRKTRIAIGATAEGVKKVAILDQLLGNRFLDQHSVVILDEPEAGLHPAAISALMDILLLLAEAGVQIFIASHSYFVLKKAYLLAQKNHLSIPILSLEGAQDLRYDDLLDGLPDNAIMQESIRLYEEEIDEVL